MTELIRLSSGTLNDRIQRLDVDISNIEKRRFAHKLKDLVKFCTIKRFEATYAVLIEQVKSQSFDRFNETFSVFEYATPPVVISH